MHRQLFLMQKNFRERPDETLKNKLDQTKN